MESLRAVACTCFMRENLVQWDDLLAATERPSNKLRDAGFEELYHQDEVEFFARGRNPGVQRTMRVIFR